MVLDDEIKIRVSREMKRELEDRNINFSEVLREALAKELGKDATLQPLMENDLHRFEAWSEAFVRLYQFIQQKLKDKDNLTLSELTKLEQAWKTIEFRMKSREQLMEEIPELAALTYEDCFDWMKVFAIIDKYPRILKGKLGLSQIREGILYREVRKGNFEGLQQARDKLRADISERIARIQEETRSKLQSEEFRREYFLKQEETRLEEERKKAEGTKGGFE